MSKGLKKVEDKEIKLTPKQSLFLNKYLDPDSETFGNATRSYLSSYGAESYNSAGVAAHELLKKLKITRKDLMERKGIGLGRLLDKLNDGLDSNKVVSAIITGKDADSRTDDFIEVPDMATRHKYLDTAGKWYGIDKNTETIGVRTDGEKVEVIFRRETG